ncbi:MAG: hypothetical protein ACWA45_03910 [Flavobacteriales bacterium]
MKKLILLLTISLAVVSCSKENTTAIDNQENLTQQLNQDISQQLPQSNYDQSQKGLYAGVIVANDTQFHGKIWINIGNDGNYTALVQTIEGDKLEFNLDNQTPSLNKNTYTFTNERGSFQVNLTDITKVTVSNITIDGTEGYIHVRKEVNNTKVGITLGTYDAAYAGASTGTWDFLDDGAGGGAGVSNITETMATGAGGGMQIDYAVDFEGTTPECYTGGPFAPFFWEDPSDNRYEIYMTGQTVTLTNGDILLFDFGFSKNICDANGLDYLRGLYFPEATNNVFFGGVAAGCYNIGTGGQGVYARFDSAGEAGGNLKSAGNIMFDTSGLVPAAAAAAQENLLESVEVKLK